MTVSTSEHPGFPDHSSPKSKRAFGDRFKIEPPVNKKSPDISYRYLCEMLRSMPDGFLDSILAAIFLFGSYSLLIFFGLNRGVPPIRSVGSYGDIINRLGRGLRDGCHEYHRQASRDRLSLCPSSRHSPRGPHVSLLPPGPSSAP